MSHSELEELAAGYVLGALEPDDEHAFQRHLEGCPTCHIFPPAHNDKGKKFRANGYKFSGVDSLRRSQPD